MIVLSRLLPYLQCPRSGTPLSVRHGALISEAGHTYPIVNGKPILVRFPQPLHFRPPPQEIISRNIPEFVFDPNCPADGLVLHLGCGDVPSYDRRVVSVDVLPTDATDLVTEAEALPFRDNTFDRVVSGAVFEHVYDPMRSAREVRRVIKEGGSFYIDTAFLQGYHGFPSHFFNMTPQAIETYLVDGFSLLHSCVPDSGTVGYTITVLLRRLLEGLPTEEAAALLEMSVGQMLEEIEADPSRNNQFLKPLSEFSHRALASSFVVIAQKPRGHSEPEHSHEGSSWQQEAITRRNYYAARMAVMQRYHEIEQYRRKALAGHPELVETKEERPLNDILYAQKPPDTCSFFEATVVLQLEEKVLTVLRDEWIRRL
jgi:SAM-dependent methyltransferase